MPCTLWEKHNYLNKDFKYIKNTKITEYDIHAAGTCILYDLGLINEKFFNYLMTLDKFTRNEKVGLLLRDHSEWNKLQMSGFSKIMKLFMEKNNIEDSDILSIKKDSITIIGNIPINYLNFKKLYHFNEAGKYNSYMFINGKEIYLNTNTLEYDLKNFNEEIIKVQNDYFINFILSTMIIDSKNNKDSVFNHLKEFRTKFLNKELDDEYYYNLDKDEPGYIYDKNGTLFLTNYKDKDKKYYINNNYNYLEELIKIMLSNNDLI